jgi:hypothetical protein
VRLIKNLAALLTTKNGFAPRNVISSAMRRRLLNAAFYQLAITMANSRNQEDFAICIEHHIRPLPFFLGMTDTLRIAL